jgi:ribose transport system ATP-binding protein
VRLRNTPPAPDDGGRETEPTDGTITNCVTSAGPSDQDGTTPDLTASGMTRSFGAVQALAGANLACGSGRVHGLVGENGAGKSTLVKILSGAISADRGRMSLAGEELRFHTPNDARKAGIGTVFQELSLIPDISVAANLFYGHEPRVIAGRIAVRRLRRAGRDVLDQYGFPNIDPGAHVRELRLAERQLVEVVKSLIRKPRVLILDEPTSALPPEHVAWLFKTVREFAAQGGIVIFISHRLAEIEELCDEVTVFRGGVDVGSGRLSDMSESQLVELMLGRKVERFYPPAPEKLAGEEAGVACEVKGLKAPPRLRGIDLQVRAGEIVGIGGLEGQGQSDVFLALFGARRVEGTILLKNRHTRLRSPGDAVKAGIGLVPEDRATEGLCLPLSIRDNISLGDLPEVSRFGFMMPLREQRLVAKAVNALQIKLRTPRQEVNSLSGGNQQKVLLARVLSRNPALLLMYDATRGVDVGTKTEIYRLMREQCEKGVGILFYSTDASELAHMADRVLVLHDGVIRAHLQGSQISEENIVAAAIGGGIRGAA